MVGGWGGMHSPNYSVEVVLWLCFCWGCDNNSMDFDFSAIHPIPQDLSSRACPNDNKGKLQ